MGEGINGFAFDLEEASAELEQLKVRAKKVQDNRVCVCGHPMGRHREDSEAGRFYPGKTHQCKPNASYCKCDSPVPVLKADDLRYFLRSTQGIGHLHALGHGVVAATKAGSGVEWLNEPTCNRCDEVGSVIPVCFSREGIRMDEGAEITLLLCSKCVSEVK
jgi:hypothetical protein